MHIHDIAFEFASWISAEFKLYIIKDYKRLKADENSRFSLNWNLNRLSQNIHERGVDECWIWSVSGRPEERLRALRRSCHRHKWSRCGVRIEGPLCWMWCQHLAVRQNNGKLKMPDI